MAVNKELDRIVRQAKKRGWEVSLTRKNHRKLYHPKAGTIFTSGTPSKPSVVANFRAELARVERKAGIV